MKLIKGDSVFVLADRVIPQTTMSIGAWLEKWAFYCLTGGNPVIAQNQLHKGINILTEVLSMSQWSLQFP